MAYHCLCSTKSHICIIYAVQLGDKGINIHQHLPAIGEPGCSPIKLLALQTLHAGWLKSPLNCAAVLPCSLNGAFWTLSTRYLYLILQWLQFGRTSCRLSSRSHLPNHEGRWADDKPQRMLESMGISIVYMSRNGAFLQASAC